MSSHTTTGKLTNPAPAPLANTASLTPAAPPPTPAPSSALDVIADFRNSPVGQVAQLAASGALVYHGYKRNHGSIGWALGWFVMSGMFPLMIPIALAQGFAKPAAQSDTKKNPLKRSKKRRKSKR